MDDINKPLDRAIWWLEYAVRHPGSFLKFKDYFNKMPLSWTDLMKEFFIGGAL
jgi:hypothetical protein